MHLGKKVLKQYVLQSIRSLPTPSPSCIHLFASGPSVKFPNPQALTRIHLLYTYRAWYRGWTMPSTRHAMPCRNMKQTDFKCLFLKWEEIHNFSHIIPVTCPKLLYHLDSSLVKQCFVSLDVFGIQSTCCWSLFCLKFLENGERPARLVITLLHPAVLHLCRCFIKWCV